MAKGAERIRRVFGKQASKYDRQMAFSERMLFGDSRAWAIGQARGQVLELGIGTGLNLPHYRADTRVIGVDLSEQMLAIAQRRATGLGVSGRVELRLGDAEHTGLPDKCVDTVVSTLTFCTTPDPLAAAREAFRVLKPGGEFLLVEHGPATSRVIRGAQRVIEWFTVPLQADYQTRDPVPYLARAGFTVKVQQRRKAGIVFRIVAAKTA